MGPGPPPIPIARPQAGSYRRQHRTGASALCAASRQREPGSNPCRALRWSGCPKTPRRDGHAGQLRSSAVPCSAPSPVQQRPGHPTRDRVSHSVGIQAPAPTRLVSQSFSGDGTKHPQEGRSSLWPCPRRLPRTAEGKIPNRLQRSLYPGAVQSGSGLQQREGPGKARAEPPTQGVCGCCLSPRQHEAPVPQPS